MLEETGSFSFILLIEVFQKVGFEDRDTQFPVYQRSIAVGPVERRAGEFRGLVALALEIFGEDGGPLRGERGGVGERRAVAS
eukprot:COSAG03_NODE_4465_length_1542_cov_2.785863_4_plen_82_part_00